MLSSSSPASESDELELSDELEPFSEFKLSYFLIPPCPTFYEPRPPKSLRPEGTWPSAFCAVRCIPHSGLVGLPGNVQPKRVMLHPWDFPGRCMHLPRHLNEARCLMSSYCGAASAAAGGVVSLGRRLGTPGRFRWPEGIAKCIVVVGGTAGARTHRRPDRRSLHTGLQPFTCDEMVAVARCARAARHEALRQRTLSSDSSRRTRSAC